MLEPFLYFNCTKTYIYLVAEKEYLSSKFIHVIRYSIQLKLKKTNQI